MNNFKKQAESIEKERISIRSYEEIIKDNQEKAIVKEEQTVKKPKKQVIQSIEPIDENKGN
jgi:hypothetical protein